MQNYIPQNTNDTFIAMLTHDLKTPINSGIFALEMLLKDSSLNFTEYQSEVLTDVLNATKFMKHLTENVLCKYKSESGNLYLQKERCSFRELTKMCLEETKYILQDKKQTLKFICPNDNTDAIFDVLEMRRVVNNLISNASEYSPKYGEIIVSLTKTCGKIQFSIQDFGCGINLKELKNIFEQYVSLAKEQRKAGTGLGLYITKLIVDAHGGKIKIKSKPNEGTKISFTLPEN